MNPIEHGSGDGHSQVQLQAQEIAGKLVEEIGAWTKHAPDDPATTAALDKTVGQINSGNIDAVKRALKDDPAASHLPKLSLDMEWANRGGYRGPDLYKFGGVSNRGKIAALSITETKTEKVADPQGVVSRLDEVPPKESEVKTSSTYTATPVGFEQPGDISHIVFGYEHGIS